MRSWLASMSKGAECAQAVDLEVGLPIVSPASDTHLAEARNTSIDMGSLSDNPDPACMVDVIVIGKRKGECRSSPCRSR